MTIEEIKRAHHLAVFVKEAQGALAHLDERDYSNLDFKVDFTAWQGDTSKGGWEDMEVPLEMLRWMLTEGAAHARRELEAMGVTLETANG